MPQTNSSKNLAAISNQSIDLISQFKIGLVPTHPWDSIIDFAVHPSFCGKRLYPRQRTLLKLIYLETDNMTDYDKDVIEEWTSHFFDHKNSYGVQPDIWERVKYLKDNGYTHFPHVQAVQGRRASKGLIGGILGAERVAHMVSLGDPQAYYGVDKNKTLYLFSVATNINQAKRFQFADILQTIQSCRWLDPYRGTSSDSIVKLVTQGDKALINDIRARRLPMPDREIASIQAMAMSSTSASGRGGTSFAHFFDEFAHMIAGSGGPRSSEEVYEAYQPSLDQFGKDALTYIPSSPYTRTGKMYDLYQSGRVLMPSYLAKNGEAEVNLESGEESEEDVLQIVADPEMLIIQLPSWEIYKDWERGKELSGIRFRGPIQYPPEGDRPENLRMARFEDRNPEKFKVERRAQFASVIDAYLNPDKVDKMLGPVPWTGKSLTQQEHGIAAFSYTGHADPGMSNANFAMAIGHLEPCPIPEKDGKLWQHVIIDRTVVWNPADFNEHTIDYVQVQEDIEDVLRRFPNMEKFTFDQWNSASLIAHLRKWSPQFMFGTHFGEETFTNKRNKEVAEQFKTALNMEWVHAPKDFYFNKNLASEGSLLEQELKFLQERNGVIEKQKSGPVTTKDLADTVMAVTTRLLESQLSEINRESLSTGPISTNQSSYPQVNGYKPFDAGVRNNRDILNSWSSSSNMGYARNRARGR